MSNNYDFLYGDEITVMNLRRLYENCGFSKYRMGKFESYDFYAKNMDFLVGNRIITFSDLNGKLMALKPDVTLSIVKNAEHMKGRQKLYYTENVYRESKDIHEFREIFQVGLEVLGDIDLIESAEIVSLAVKSLLEIDENSILDISHMGYIEGLIDCMTDNKSVRNEILSLFSQKNIHDMNKLAESCSLPSKPVETAVRLMSSNCLNDDAIEEAINASLNEKMKSAATELKAIYQTIEKMGFGNHIKIDLSVTDDPSYYNGILMHGYVHGIPRDVLSGGRYDMLMNKMGKKNTNAMGFAIYFDALDRKLHTKEKSSPDAYIIYNENSDADAVFGLMKELDSKNISYNAITSLPDNIRNVSVFTVCGNEVKEEKL